MRLVTDASAASARRSLYLSEGGMHPRSELAAFRWEAVRHDTILLPNGSVPKCGAHRAIRVQYDKFQGNLRLFRVILLDTSVSREIIEV